MAQLRNSKAGAAFTLLEVLVSVGLLLLLSGLLFSSIFPILQRGRHFENQQSTVRKFLIARERLIRELRHINPSATPPSITTSGKVVLEYYRPREQTYDGIRFGTFDLGEVVAFDTTTWEIFLSSEGNLIIRESGIEPGVLVWGMGSGADVDCLVATGPARLEFEFRLQTETQSSTKTTRTIDLVIPLD